MMEIKVVIRPNKLALLRTALLHTPGFPGMTVSKVEGCSASVKVNRVTIKDELTDYSAKVRIEIICSRDLAPMLMDKIIAVCQTGKIDDSLVWCTPVSNALLIPKALG